MTELSQKALPRKENKRTGTQIRFLYDKKVFSKGWVLAAKLVCQTEHWLFTEQYIQIPVLSLVRALLVQ